MRVEGEYILLKRESVADWFRYELSKLEEAFWSDPQSCTYHKKIIEVALGLLELAPSDYKAIMAGVDNPEDEELLGRAKRAAFAVLTGDVTVPYKPDLPQKDPAKGGPGFAKTNHKICPVNVTGPLRPVSLKRTLRR